MRGLPGSIASITQAIRALHCYRELQNWLPDGACIPNVPNVLSVLNNAKIHTLTCHFSQQQSLLLLPADINECKATPSPCTGPSSSCNNTQGGFTCSCTNPGYMLDPADNRTCIGKESLLLQNLQRQHCLRQPSCHALSKRIGCLQPLVWQPQCHWHHAARAARYETAVPAAMFHTAPCS